MNDSKPSFEEKVAALRAQIDERAAKDEAWMQVWREKQAKEVPSKFAKLRRWIGLSIALNGIFAILLFYAGFPHS